jgi:hypothetical protein
LRAREPVREITAKALVLVLAGATLAAAALLRPSWLERHILPEFFEPRDEQLRALTAFRGVLVACGLLLVWPVRPWIGRLVARKRPGELAADWLPILLAVVLALWTSEYLLRHLPWFATHQLPTQREPLRRRDPVTGWVYAENRVGRGVLGGRIIEYAFDPAGHRVRAAGQAVDYDRPTTLFVGESIMTGHGVTYDESIPGQVEARTGLQAANLSVGGFATDQMLMRLRPEWPRYRDPRALVILFMPSLFHRNLEHDRPHLDPGLVWRPSADEWRLVQVARRLAPYRSDRELAEGRAMTRRALGVMVGMAQARGAVPLIVVPQLTPETAEEAAIRAEVLRGLPYLQVSVDPSWRVPGNRHPDARADAKIAQAVTAYLVAHGLSAAPRTQGAIRWPSTP